MRFDRGREPARVPAPAAIRKASHMTMFEDVRRDIKAMPIADARAMADAAIARAEGNGFDVSGRPLICWPNQAAAQKEPASPEAMHDALVVFHVAEGAK